MTATALRFLVILTLFVPLIGCQPLERLNFDRLTRGFGGNDGKADTSDRSAASSAPYTAAMTRLDACGPERRIGTDSSYFTLMATHGGIDPRNRDHQERLQELLADNFGEDINFAIVKADVRVRGRRFLVPLLSWDETGRIRPYAFQGGTPILPPALLRRGEDVAIQVQAFVTTLPTVREATRTVPAPTQTPTASGQGQAQGGQGGQGGPAALTPSAAADQATATATPRRPAKPRSVEIVEELAELGLLSGPGASAVVLPLLTGDRARATENLLHELFPQNKRLTLASYGFHPFSETAEPDCQGLANGFAITFHDEDGRPLRNMRLAMSFEPRGSLLGPDGRSGAPDLSGLQVETIKDERVQVLTRTGALEEAVVMSLLTDESNYMGEANLGEALIKTPISEGSQSRFRRTLQEACIRVDRHLEAIGLSRTDRDIINLSLLANNSDLDFVEEPCIDPMHMADYRSFGLSLPEPKPQINIIEKFLIHLNYHEDLNQEANYLVWVGNAMRMLADKVRVIDDDGFWAPSNASGRTIPGSVLAKHLGRIMERHYGCGSEARERGEKFVWMVKADHWKDERIDTVGFVRHSVDEVSLNEWDINSYCYFFDPPVILGR